ncbi:MAG: stage II sporulation protein M [Oscillospiraceae bacterium]|nr:stage II sporulation protein M [Oscillospiraceae bacterium]
MGELHENQTGDLVIADPTTNDDVTDDGNPGTTQKHTIYLLLACFFLLGLLLGVLFMTKADASVLDTLDCFFFSSVHTRTEGALLPVFIASMASSFFFLLAIFFCGLTMWGAFVVPILPLLRGFGLGLTAGYVYHFGWHGILYYLAVMLPGAYLASLMVLFSAAEAIRFSKRLNFSHKARRKRYAFVPQPSVKTYLLRFGIMASLSIFAALLDVATTFLFSGFFQSIF